MTKNPKLKTKKTPFSNTPKDPFDGYLKTPSRQIPSSTKLLSSSRSKRVLNALCWSSQNDLYIYQQAIEKKSGPRVLLKGREYLMISAYDYLGLIGHPRIEAAAVEAIQKYGTGTAGVRLLTGTTDLHHEFEKELAEFKGTEAALTFSSGYLANLSVISTIFGPKDLIIIDSKAHRSIIEACRLAKVQMQRFDHNDPYSLQEKLEARQTGQRTLIIVEGIYSMDGDICPLPEIIELKKKYGASLMIDEAHSFGVLGKSGRGVDSHFNQKTDDVDIWMGSLSKAVPSNGGFIAGKKDFIIFLQHASAHYIFSAALCPASVASARETLRVFEDEPERFEKLKENTASLRQGLIELGYDTGVSTTPVIPVILGADETAYVFSRKLFSLGIFATPVVRPAVPPGSARIRLCATAAQDKHFIQEIIEGFRKVRDSE